MLSLIIYVIEVPDVATVEIPGALLQTDYNKGYINIKMEGVMVTLMEEIDPAYYKGFVYLDSRGKKCMYAEANKAIYSTLEASHIFWTKLSKSLEKWATIETNITGLWWTNFSKVKSSP